MLRFLTDRGSQFVHRSEPDSRFKPEDRVTTLCDRASLLTCHVPGRVTVVQIAGENEARGQRSFPPIRPCLVMVARTSTIARTATSAVMSEIS
jgi:hypothetical protein